MAETPKASFASQAATASALIPCLVFVIGIAISQPKLRAAGVIIGPMNIGLLLLGLVLGVYAWLNRTKFNQPNSRSYALGGMIANGVMLIVAGVAVVLLSRLASP